jgi:hypothetical protein
VADEGKADEGKDVEEKDVEGRDVEGRDGQRGDGDGGALVVGVAIPLRGAKRTGNNPGRPNSASSFAASKNFLHLRKIYLQLYCLAGTVFTTSGEIGSTDSQLWYH